MKKTKKKIYAGSLILKILVILAAVFTLVMLGYLIVYILAKGIPASDSVAVFYTL